MAGEAQPEFEFAEQETERNETQDRGKEQPAGQGELRSVGHEGALSERIGL